MNVVVKQHHDDIQQYFRPTLLLGAGIGLRSKHPHTDSIFVLSEPYMCLVTDYILQLISLFLSFAALPKRVWE